MEHQIVYVGVFGAHHFNTRNGVGLTAQNESALGNLGCNLFAFHGIRDNAIVAYVNAEVGPLPTVAGLVGYNVLRVAMVAFGARSVDVNDIALLQRGEGVDFILLSGNVGTPRNSLRTSPHIGTRLHRFCNGFHLCIGNSLNHYFCDGVGLAAEDESAFGNFCCNLFVCHGVGDDAIVAYVNVEVGPLPTVAGFVGNNVLRVAMVASGGNGVYFDDVARSQLAEDARSGFVLSAGYVSVPRNGF